MSHREQGGCQGDVFPSAGQYTAHSGRARWSSIDVRHLHVHSERRNMKKKTGQGKCVSMRKIQAIASKKIGRHSLLYCAINSLFRVSISKHIFSVEFHRQNWVFAKLLGYSILTGVKTPPRLAWLQNIIIKNSMMNRLNLSNFAELLIINKQGIYGAPLMHLQFFAKTIKSGVLFTSQQ